MSCIKSFLYKADLIFYLFDVSFCAHSNYINPVLTLFIKGEVNIDPLRSTMLEN